ncbi:MAG: hypothetical protein GF346_03240, partial [Candidatus Eisenbacteria bacterium]|nr:hypothetical protein [Candidatus Latescibacterota bacterium]MBD3301436.1 hypothetical protein [Candidatus Eisenbacteria bacterium]
MKKFAFVLALSAIFAGAALAEEPMVMYDGPGGSEYDYDRATLWIDPPDAAGNIGSSEIILEFELYSEIANDFILEQDATVRLWRWWGGYWNGYEQYVVNYFMIRIYEDAGCVPGNMLAELQVDIADVDYEVFEAEPLFVHTYCYEVDFAANLYWFGVQGEHAFPPQFGRL